MRRVSRHGGVQAGMDTDVKTTRGGDVSADELIHLGASLTLLAAILVWVYRHALAGAAQRWSVDPLYQHGYVVPMLALLFLFWRRDVLQPMNVRPNWAGLGLLAGGSALWIVGTQVSGWISAASLVPIALGARAVAAQFRPAWSGLVLLAAGLVLRFAGEFYFVDALAMLSFIPALAGIFALVGGWNALRWSWPALAFLLFMFPLPYRVETALQEPLRQIGTTASVYVIQTLGIHAVPMGNIIVLGEHHVGVEEACSGLAMLMVFLAITVVFAMAMQRPRWERAVILASAVPIALVANIARITVTAVFFSLGHDKLADMLFHDVAGLLMPLFAVSILALEASFLSRMVIAEEDRPLVVGLDEDGALHERPVPRASPPRQRAKPVAASAGANFHSER